jgi:RHS repeat-associated protein
LQGSTNTVTDSLGNVFQHNEYFPTGETWVSENSTIFRTPYQYAGGYTDDVRRTIDLGARWYDQDRELFYSPDPALADSAAIVDQPSLRAAYAFAGSNAAANIDPGGRLWATVNQKYAALQAQSRAQIIDLVEQNGPNGKAFFKAVYGRSFNSLGWHKKASDIAERISAPLFEFRVTKAANGSQGVTLSILGFRPRGLNETARLQIAADNLAAAAPANAQAQPDPLTPEAEGFAKLFTLFKAPKSGVPAAAGAGSAAAPASSAAASNTAVAGPAAASGAAAQPSSSRSSSAAVQVAAQQSADTG